MLWYDFDGAPASGEMGSSSPDSIAEVRQVVDGDKGEEAADVGDDKRGDDAREGEGGVAEG
jgi:hypothetical protein